MVLCDSLAFGENVMLKNLQDPRTSFEPQGLSLTYEGAPVLSQPSFFSISGDS